MLKVKVVGPTRMRGGPVSELKPKIHISYLPLDLAVSPDGPAWSIYWTKYRLLQIRYFFSIGVRDMHLGVGDAPGNPHEALFKVQSRVGSMMVFIVWFLVQNQCIQFYFI